MSTNVNEFWGRLMSAVGRAKRVHLLSEASAELDSVDPLPLSDEEIELIVNEVASRPRSQATNVVPHNVLCVGQGLEESGETDRHRAPCDLDGSRRRNAHASSGVSGRQDVAPQFSGSAVEERTLSRILVEGAPRLRGYLTTKIPAKLQGAISAEDLLQEVWLSAFQGLGSFRHDEPGALDRWLTCIANRKLLNAIKAAQRVKRGGRHVILQGNGNRVSSMLDQFVRVAAPGRTPSSEAVAAEARDAVQIALASLPEARRRAIWMRHIEGKPCDEIAVAMGKTKPAVNGLLFHGLRQLRDQLGEPSRFLSDAPDSEEPSIG